MSESLAHFIGGFFYGSIICGYIIWFWGRIK